MTGGCGCRRSIAVPFGNGQYCLQYEHYIHQTREGIIGKNILSVSLPALQEAAWREFLRDYQLSEISQEYGSIDRKVQTDG
jgi:hypothetical protein